MQKETGDKPPPLPPEPALLPQAQAPRGLRALSLPLGCPQEARGPAGNIPSGLEGLSLGPAGSLVGTWRSVTCGSGTGPGSDCLLPLLLWEAPSVHPVFNSQGHPERHVLARAGAGIGRLSSLPRGHVQHS